VRVTLMHNPTAGDEEHSPEQLTAVLQDAGHEVLYQSVKEDGWPDALGARAELVVVAGGDGTVAKVFKELVGRDLPVALLPLGSANNVARTLGLAGDAPMRFVAAWKGGRIRHMTSARSNRPAASFAS
jgi:diacylglycerol kinase (ATP)